MNILSKMLTVVTVVCFINPFTVVTCFYQMGFMALTLYAYVFHSLQTAPIFQTPY